MVAQGSHAASEAKPAAQGVPQWEQAPGPQWDRALGQDRGQSSCGTKLCQHLLGAQRTHSVGAQASPWHALYGWSGRARGLGSSAVLGEAQSLPQTTGAWEQAKLGLSQYP